MSRALALFTSWMRPNTRVAHYGLCPDLTLACPIQFITITIHSNSNLAVLKSVYAWRESWHQHCYFDAQIGRHHPLIAMPSYILQLSQETVSEKILYRLENGELKPVLQWIFVSLLLVNEAMISTWWIAIFLQMAMSVNLNSDSHTCCKSNTRPLFFVWKNLPYTLNAVLVLLPVLSNTSWATVL